MARNIGVNFNGKRIVRPGAHSRIDSQGLGAFGSSSEKKLILLGSSQGGEPNKYHSFTNYSEARNTLRGGNLLKAAELAWAPSGDGVGAGEIGFVRVEEATQGVLDKAGFKLTSKLYGSEANKIQAKLEDGSIAGSKKLTVYFWTDNAREIYDQLGPVFNFKYTGADAYAGLTIQADANGKAEKFIVKTGADKATATELVAYDLGATAEFKEVNKLINEIGSHPELSASVTLAGNKTLDTDVLDAVADQDIKTPFIVTALKGDIESQLAYSRLVTVAVKDGEVENFESEYLTGGSNGSVPASWADKLDLVSGEGGYIIVPLTADEAIHAEVARYVESQSNNEKNEMRAFYGGGMGETVDQAINRAVTLNSHRAVQCYPAITRKAADNTTESLPAYFTAALVAGRSAGVPVAEPVTFDYLNLIGVEKVLSSGEIDKLLENGVTPIEYVRTRNRKGFRVAQCVTTYQDDNNPSYRENSISELMDFLNIELREHLESRFVGTKGTAVTGALIKNEVQSFLDQKVREEWLVEYDPESVVVLDGEVVEVSYAAMPVTSVNYILITGSFYRSALTAS